MTFYLTLAAINIAVILASFFLFSSLISGEKRHSLWENYISSFSRFVVYVFLISLFINVLIAYIIYSISYQRYINIVNPIVQSIFIGFVVSCVPRRGVGDKKILK